MTDALRLVQTEWFVRDMLDIAEEQRRRVTRRLDNLVSKGWAMSLADGTLSHLRDGIWEVRVVGSGAAFRVLCFSAPGNPGRLVVLTACLAKAHIKKPRVMEAEIQRAINRRAAWFEKEGLR